MADAPGTGGDAAEPPELSHFTVIAEGVVGVLAPGLSCRPGPAMMGIKVWASSSQHAARMVQQIGKHVGFTVSGRAEIYATAPTRPSGDKPFGYDIQFTPFDAAGASKPTPTESPEAR